MPKNILVINFGGIGDEILFLPALSSLKQEFPDSKITLCLEPRSKSIKDLSNLIDEVLPIDVKGKDRYKELARLVKEARAGKFDVVISSGGNKLISVLLSMTGIKERYGFDTGFLSKLLYTKAVKLDQKRYASAMYHELVTPLTDNVTLVPQIEINETIEKEQGSVLVHPGVSKISIIKNIIKTWTPEVWAELIEKLLNKGKKVYLIGGPDDEECIKTILALFENKDCPNFVNLYGTTKNIMDFAKLAKRAEVLICSDSAPMHIGVAVGTRTLGLFGPTDEKKLLPENDLCTAVKNECDCRPCLWDKRQTTCEELKCLKIDLDKVVEMA